MYTGPSGTGTRCWWRNSKPKVCAPPNGPAPASLSASAPLPPTLCSCAPRWAIGVARWLIALPPATQQGGSTQPVKQTISKVVLGAYLREPSWDSSLARRAQSTPSVCGSVLTEAQASLPSPSALARGEGDALMRPAATPLPTSSWTAAAAAGELTLRHIPCAAVRVCVIVAICRCKCSQRTTARAGLLMQLLAGRAQSQRAWQRLQRSGQPCNAWLPPQPASPLPRGRRGPEVRRRQEAPPASGTYGRTEALWGPMSFLKGDERPLNNKKKRFKVHKDTNFSWSRRVVKASPLVQPWPRATAKSEEDCCASCLRTRATGHSITSAQICPPRNAFACVRCRASLLCLCARLCHVQQSRSRSAVGLVQDCSTCRG